jgi:hypothetical protein
MNLKNINCLALPKWVEDLLVGFGGLAKFDTVDVHEIGRLTPTDCLVVYEESYLVHRESLIDCLKEGKLKTLVIFNTHPFLFNDSTLTEINTLSKTFDIHILCDGHYAKRYDSLTVHNFGLCEHTVSHHFNFLLSLTLEKRKKEHEKTFLLQVVEKDEFRKTVTGGVAASDLSDDVIFTNRRGKFGSAELMDKHNSLIDSIEKKYKICHDIIAAINGFGVAPNFAMYERSFCEIVVETKNTGAYHLTEKTFRPICLRMPIIFLGSKIMYDELCAYGYTFYDNNFYHRWHDNDLKLQDRVQILVEFMHHIKEDSTARKKMQVIADHNYNLFWIERKLNYYKNWHNIMKKILKDKDISNRVDDVYSWCNF